MWLWSWLWFLFTWMNDRKYRETEEKLWQMVWQKTETFFQGIFSIISSWNQLMERNWILYADTVYPDTIILLNWLVEVLKLLFFLWYSLILWDAPFFICLYISVFLLYQNCNLSKDKMLTMTYICLALWNILEWKLII